MRAKKSNPSQYNTATNLNREERFPNPKSDHESDQSEGAPEAPMVLPDVPEAMSQRERFQELLIGFVPRAVHTASAGQECGGEPGDAETGIRGAKDGGIGEVPPETRGASDDQEKQ